MDGPMAIVYEDVEIQLCCSACIAEFRKDPEKYVAKVRAKRT
jgi:YHS domain-containing protein